MIKIVFWITMHANFFLTTLEPIICTAILRHCLKNVTMLHSRRKRTIVLSTEWIENLLEKIRDHIESRKYRVTEHAISRQKLRSLKLPDILEVFTKRFS